MTNAVRNVLMILIQYSNVGVGGWVEILAMLHFETFALDNGVGRHFVERRILSVVVLPIGAVLLGVEAED